MKGPQKIREVSKLKIVARSAAIMINEYKKAILDATGDERCPKGMEDLDESLAQLNEFYHENKKKSDIIIVPSL